MKCMIVEDEEPAVKVLENYIESFKDLEVASIHNNAIDAITDLQKNQYDILFLDIQLPKMSGIQLLNALKNPPAVILTTAHREYAIDGYELEILDYLLKPISFDRFAKAVAKVFQSAQQQIPATPPQAHSENGFFSEPFIYVKSEREFVKILLNDLLYVESIKNHVKLVTKTETVVTLMSLTAVEEKLPQQLFLRVHRSFIVSTQHINSFNQHDVRIGNAEIPIGRHYKQQFQKWMDENVV